MLAVLVAASALLGVNAIVLGNQTKPAAVNVPGGKLLETPNGTVQVTDSGPRSGSPIVLIHCYSCSLRWWDGMLPELERKHRVVRLDLLGHGGSEKPSDGYSMEDQAHTVSSVLDQLGVTHATVVGHSMGVAVETALAELDPDQVARLVIIDWGSSNGGSSLGWSQQVATVPLLGPALRHAPDFALSDGVQIAFAPDYDFADGFEQDDQPVQDIRAMTYTAFVDARNAADNFREESSLVDRLTPLGIPLLVMFGSEDQTIDDVEGALDEYQGVPGAQLRLIEGAGHSPNVEKPKETAAAVLGFARQGDRPRREAP